MILKEDLMIDGLHYILKFDHYSFSFSLNRPPRASNVVPLIRPLNSVL